MRIYMRFEYALKEIGYLRTANGSAQADFHKFSDEKLGSSLFDKIVESEEARVLVTSPPSRQISDNGILGWKKAENSPTNMISLIECIQRVRNNLVHGGKSGLPDESRNEALINGATFAVLKIVKEDDGLREAFEGKY